MRPVYDEWGPFSPKEAARRKKDLKSFQSYLQKIFREQALDELPEMGRPALVDEAARVHLQKHPLGVGLFSLKCEYEQAYYTDQDLRDTIQEMS